ncbi:MAG: hypothetical protein Fues2KO_07320 [Fuerstiella sp.]
MGSVCLVVAALSAAAGFLWQLSTGFAASDAPQAMQYRVKRGDLVVTVREQGMVESAENIEIKSKVRGWNAVLWIIDSGTLVKKGDEVVRLDAFRIQEQIDERTKYANWSQSAADRSDASVKSATIAIDEYREGRYQTELLALQKDVAVTQAQLRGSTDALVHLRTMASSGFISQLEVDDAEFRVEQLQRSLDLKKTELEVLRNYTFKERMQTLKGNLQSITANHKANVERAMADGSRRDRAVEELQHCVIKAPADGLVIHPNAAQWESQPIAEGTNVHQDQLLLLMPDVNQMQVKVGVHESVLKRVKPGQPARVIMAEGELQGEVTSVASVTKPAGWWTGNQVRYDTLVSLPARSWLRPGGSAEVEIIVAEYTNELLIPVAAIVEDERGSWCWVQTPSGPRRRSIETGDSNDVFTIVQSGLKENDAVLLNPAAFETSTESDSSTEESDDPAASDEPASSTDDNQTARSPQQETTAPKKKEVAS